MEMIVMICCSVIISYVVLVSIRNYKIYEIRQKWIFNNDYRVIKYTYDDMLLPSLKNWFGFKMPKENDFK